MRFTAFTRSELCSGFESEEHVVVYVNQLRVIGEVRSDAWYGRETNRLITFCTGRCGDVGTKPESTDDASSRCGDVGTKPESTDDASNGAGIQCPA